MPIANALLEYNLMDERDAPPHITLFVNSTGGDLFATYHLIDMIKQSDIPVHTLGIGCIASGGIMLLMAGKKGHRFVTENTYLMSHQYSTGVFGKEHELRASVYELELQSKRMVNHYVKCTKKSEAYVRKHLLHQSDISISPQDAVKHGIVDKILAVY
jgi:ATP-dependent Clp protease protease subunit